MCNTDKKKAYQQNAFKNDDNAKQDDEKGTYDEEKIDEKKIIIDESLNSSNDELAGSIRDELDKKDILCINIMGSPGSGKTTFIENLCRLIGKEKTCVIQGDLESDIDKQRLEQDGIATFQINTHSGCHLNAHMIRQALSDMDLKDKRYLLIENVGNLVCPAGVKLGQHKNIVLSSTAEGSDKPKKYPVIFHDADLIVITKYDLKDAVDFDEDYYIKELKNINPKATVIMVSSKEPSSFAKAKFLLG